MTVPASRPERRTVFDRLHTRLRVKRPRPATTFVPAPYPVDASTLLAGRTALIAGGSGGLGRAIAASYAEAGAAVVLAGRDAARLEEAARAIGPGASWMLLDLIDPSSFGDSLDALELLPDVLVNAAGVLSTKPFGSIDLEEFDRVMDTNLRGVLFLSQELSRRWIARGMRGNVLNVSSGSQLKPGWTSYQISKNALGSLTRGMASFLVQHDIVVNAIAPGPVATEMLGLHQSDLSFPGNPTGRALTPEEVAQWCTWLVSDYGRYAVGTTFELTGGNGIFQWERQGPFRQG